MRGREIMRDIRFRCWDKKREEMFKVTALFPFEKMARYREELPNTYNYFYDKECILMQYTGLKDSKGVEIYEGDIIPYKGKNEVVNYKNGEYALGGWRLGFLPHYKGILKAEVIGNIYKHPELLEEK